MSFEPLKSMIRLLSFSALFSSIFYALGILWTVVEATDFFFSSESWGQSIKEYWWLFLLFGTVIGLLRAWPNFSVHSKIDGTDIEVAVRVGDIFSVTDPIIIGSNTTFDTKVSDGTISPKSVQGQFTSKYFASENDLNSVITRTLDKIPPKTVRTKAAKPYGGLKEYEFGTVIVVTSEKRVAYFSAISSLNQNGVASANQNSFLDALPRMWDNIRTCGEYGHLCCPIIGSGFTRLNMTREQIIMEIIKSFLVATVEAKFSERLTIFVSHEDFGKGNVNMTRIANALEHECKYALANRSLRTTGSIGVSAGED